MNGLFTRLDVLDRTLQEIVDSIEYQALLAFLCKLRGCLEGGRQVSRLRGYRGEMSGETRGALGYRRLGVCPQN